MNDDGKITPTEKTLLKPAWDRVVAEGNPTTGVIPLQAVDFGGSDWDSFTAFNTRYSELNTYLNTTLAVFADMTVSTSVSRSTWDTYWTNYYNARQVLLNAIAAKAKQIADQAKQTADELEAAMTEQLLTSEHLINPFGDDVDVVLRFNRTTGGQFLVVWNGDVATTNKALKPSDLGIARISDTEPTDTFPGMVWIDP